MSCLPTPTASARCWGPVTAATGKTRVSTTIGLIPSYSTLGLVHMLGGRAMLNVQPKLKESLTNVFFAFLRSNIHKNILKGVILSPIYNVLYICHYFCLSGKFSHNTVLHKFQDAHFFTIKYL